jgi:hypothetical protein
VPVHWQRNHATSVNPVSYWLIRTGWIFIPERPIRATPLTCRTRLPFCIIVSSPQLLSEVPTRALCDLIPAGRLQAGPSSAEAHQHAHTHAHATGSVLSTADETPTAEHSAAVAAVPRLCLAGHIPRNRPPSTTGQRSISHRHAGEDRCLMMELVRPADGHRPAEFLVVPGEDPGCSDDLCQLFA